MKTIKLTEVKIEKKVDRTNEKDIHFVITGKLGRWYHDIDHFVHNERYYCYEPDFLEMDADGEGWKELIENWEQIEEAQISYTSNDEYLPQHPDYSKKFVIALDIIKLKGKKRIPLH